MPLALRQYLYTILFVLFMNTTSANFCDIVKQKYSPSDRYVSQYGVPKNVTLYWDSDLSRVAAAQLSVILRYALGYQNVHLHQIATDTPPESPCRKNGVLKEVRITVTTTSVKQRLHVRLSKYVRNKAVCIDIDKLSFYTDDVLAECGFGDAITSGRHIVNVILQNSKTNRNLKEVTEYLNKSGLPFMYKEISRKKLFHLLKTSKQSFFFIDYDIWSGMPDVGSVEQSDGSRRQKLHTDISTSVADKCLLEEFAPQVFAIAYKYTPSTTLFLPVLETENSYKDIEEAVCKITTTRNFKPVNNVIRKYKPRKKNYVIMCFICDGDPDSHEYDELFFFLGMSRYKRRDSIFFIITRTMDLNCSDPESVIKDISDYMLHNLTSSYIGIIIGGLPNIAEVTKTLGVYNIPVMFYDSNVIDNAAVKAISSAVEEGSSQIWASTGQTLHLNLALRYFILKMGWNRITVLSDHTRMAKRLIDDLANRNHYLDIQNHIIRHNVTDIEADKILQQIKAEDAKVILVNTDYKDAATILEAAVRIKMNMDKKLTWILREWRKSTKVLNIKHFVVSFWCKRGNDILGTGTGRRDYLKKVDDLWPRHVWPPQAAAFVNAVLTVVEGFDNVMLKYPQVRDDIQSKQVIRLFERSLLEVPVKGITQTLTYKRHILEESMVYVEEWHGHRRKFRVQMRVNATSRKVSVDYVDDIEHFEQLLSDDEVDDDITTTKIKVPYILWGCMLVVVMLPTFTIKLLHRHIQRRKEIV